jgi:hypothetical protein
MLYGIILHLYIYNIIPAHHVTHDAYIYKTQVYTCSAVALLFDMAHCSLRLANRRLPPLSAGSGACGFPHCRPPDLLPACVHCQSAPPVQKLCHDPSCRAVPLVPPRRTTRQGGALNRSLPERGEQANTHLANAPCAVPQSGPFLGNKLRN